MQVPITLLLAMKVMSPCTKPALLISHGDGAARCALAESRRRPLSGSSGSNGCGSGIVADALTSTPSMSSRVIGPPLVASRARRAASNLPSPISVNAHQQAISKRCGSRSIGTDGRPRRWGLSRRFMIARLVRILRRELAPLDVGHRLSRLREFVSGGEFVLDQALEGALQRCDVGG